MHALVQRSQGFHAEQAAEGAVRIKPGAEIQHYDNRVYEAEMQIWNNNSKMWKDKFNESSFFRQRPIVLQRR